jgi:hypothetical protein
VTKIQRYRVFFIVTLGTIVALGTVLLAGENRQKKCWRVTETFRQAQNEGNFLLARHRNVSAGTSQPNKNSKYAIISNPRPCVTLVLRCASCAPPPLPCAPRVLPLPPPLHATHPLTRCPPRFRYERCPPRSRPYARHAEPTPVPSLGIARAVTTVHPTPAYTRSHPGPAPAHRVSRQNLQR